MRVWRICREQYAATAFSGEGGRWAAARWNSKGTTIAYCAEGLALASLEVFVHLAAGVRPADLVSAVAEVPIDKLDWEQQKHELVAKLSSNWRFSHEETRALGDSWATGRGSLLLPVPSVIVDDEWNVLLNPEHADAKQVQVIDIKTFQFDPRMFKEST